ncbi:hypothetical protein DICA4_B08592 [Diutina catenulata]
MSQRRRSQRMKVKKEEESTSYSESSSANGSPETTPTISVGDVPSSASFIAPKYKSDDEETTAPPADSARPAVTKKKNSRRKHRNSHLGCGTCKKRRIKCDENLPACLNCLKGKLHCAYLNLDAAARNQLRLAQYNQSLRQEKLDQAHASTVALVSGGAIAPSLKRPSTTSPKLGLPEKMYAYPQSPHIAGPSQVPYMVQQQPGVGQPIILTNPYQQGVPGMVPVQYMMAPQMMAPQTMTLPGQQVIYMPVIQQQPQPSQLPSHSSQQPSQPAHPPHPSQTPQQSQQQPPAPPPSVPIPVPSTSQVTPSIPSLPPLRSSTTSPPKDDVKLPPIQLNKDNKVKVSSLLL